jgi:hypothetical protein
MCEITKIDPLIPRLMNSNSGGAQYIMKNIDADYWEKVERDSEKLFKEITELNNQKKTTNPEYHELQIWCADMWAVLWNGWLEGNETKVVPEMDFSWATDPSNRWNQTTIYHNAGATCGSQGTFYKALYMGTLPYNLDIEKFDKEKNCYNYVLEIKETSKKSPLI